MSIQRTRWQIRGIATVLLVMSATAVSWVLFAPVAVDDSADAVGTKRVFAMPTTLVGSPPLTEFAPVWNRQLRRPLHDPPPPPPQEQKENKKDATKKRRREALAESGGLRLLGMMLENGRSMAIFTDATGRIDFKGVGETLELSPGTRVDRIELTQVTISEQGRTSVLRLPDAGAP